MPRWEVTGTTDILAVHAALLHTGHILFFGGNEFNERNHDAWANKHDPRFIDHSRLYHCATGALADPGSPPSDLFCCGHAFLASGDLLVAGGTEDWVLPAPQPGPTPPAGHAGHWPGLRDAWIFSAQRGTWLRAAPLLTEPGNRAASEADRGGGRWYPTLLTLPDGGVIALAGHPSHGDRRHQNNIPEIYDPARDSWRPWAETADQADARNQGAPDARYSYRDEAGSTVVDRVIAFYPRAFVVPGGEVFCADPQYHAADIDPRNRLRHNSLRFRADRDDPARLLPAPPPSYDTNFGNTGARLTAVLLPLLPESAYRTRVMVCGDDQAHVIDLSEAAPRWRPTAARQLTGQRIHLNAVLLPTGQVFVCGGVAPGEVGVMTAELYDPAADRWANLEPALVTRGYHSVALLMPDGRVWTAGYSTGGRPETPANPFEHRIEIYTPWYYERSRPAISWAPEQIRYRAQFDLHTPQAAGIARVALLRAGSCTHAFNADQRYVGVEFTQVAPDRLSVTAPPSGGVAPPGYYLLFIVDRDGVPSVGRFVHLNQPQPLEVRPSASCVPRGTPSVFGEVRLEYPPLRSNIDFRCDVTAKRLDTGHDLEVRPQPATVIGASAFFEVLLPPDLFGRVRVTAATNDPAFQRSAEFVVSGPGGMGCRDPLEAEISFYEATRVGCEAWDCGWTGMNDLGDLIGRSAGRLVRYLSVRGLTEPLKRLLGLPAVLRAINNRGTVIGVVQRGDGTADGFVYGEPGADGLAAPRLRWVRGVSLSAINDAGVAVGSQLKRGQLVPVRWADGRIEPIAVPAASASALAIDGAGNIAGTHVPKGDGPERAFVLDKQGFRDLGELGGSVIGLAMNGAGAVAGTVVADGRARAFAYAPETGAFDLKLPAAASQSAVSGINAMGMIVGTFWSDKDGRRRAFRFTLARGVEELDALVAADRKLALEAAVAVNNRGQILAAGSEDGVPGYFLLESKAAGKG